VAAAPVLKGIGVDEPPDTPSVLTRAMERASIGRGELPLFVRLTADWPTVESAVDGADWAAIDARVSDYERHGIAVVLALREAPVDADRVDAWRAVARALASRYRGRVAAYQLDVTGAPRPDARTYAFLLKTAAVQIRAVDPDARVAQATIGIRDLEWQRALYRDDTAAYTDIVPTDGTASVAPVRAVVMEHDAGALVLAGGVPIGAADRSDVAGWLAVALSQLGESDLRFTARGDVDAIAAVLSVARGLKDVFAGDVVSLDAEPVQLRVRQGDRDVTGTLRPRLLYNLTNFSTYLVYWGAPAGPPLVVSLLDQIGRAPVVRNPLGAAATPADDFSWNADTKQARFGAPPSTAPLVVDFNYGATDVFVSRAEARDTVLPSVSEIVFRHQQQQARQDAAYRTYIASARLEQHFRASPTEVFDIVTEARFFFGRDTVEWEELSFSVNGGRWGPDRPAFPLLQAEKVLSLPLDLRLTTDYRYELLGVDEVHGRRAYVVAFVPAPGTAARYRGRIWIDAATYARLRLNTVHADMPAPVISSEEVQTFAPIASTGGEPVYLPAHIATTDVLLIAGRNLVLEKTTAFRDVRLDPPEFESVREAARESDRIMFRDTPQGLRYLVKRGETRVVSETLTTSSKALAMGTTIDPSFDFPLPMLGLNYLDFDFLGGDSQLALLWGGPLALGNVQKPRLGRLPLDGSVDFFVMAVPGNDIVFDADGERRAERVLTVPFATGANVGYQMGAFQKVKLGYQFRYDAYLRDRETADGFLPPASSATHGLSLDYQFTRRGYTVRAAAGAYRRAGWRAWGFEDALAPPRPRYDRYSAGLTKDFYPGQFQTIRASLAWYGGRQLDRFSMYQFGLFDEVRMHGVPAAGVRFPELTLARGSYSFNVFDIYRLDVFVDRAWARDPDDRGIWRSITGTGVALNLRAPWHTMLRADIGKSFLPDRYRGAGSWVLQVMLLKPL
jgi:hypothetical protein